MYKFAVDKMRHCIFFLNWVTLVLFVSSLIPVFWTSDDLCPGFQNLSVARMATKSHSDILVQAAVAVETATQCVNV